MSLPFTPEVFHQAVAHGCAQLGIDSVRPQQLMAIEALLRGQDVLACLPTGFGKSLIFQILPAVSSFLAGHESCCSFPRDAIVLVCCPLIALMKVQVRTLRDSGFSAVYIGEDHCFDRDIESGRYTFAYGSPETLVSTQTWRSVLSSEVYARRVSAVAVDEAHTVVHW